MAGPQKPAPVQPGDTYLLVNDRDEDMEALRPWLTDRTRRPVARERVSADWMGGSP